MKIAIISATGLLGRALEIEFNKFSHFHVISTGFKRAHKHHLILNLLEKESIVSFVNLHKPDVIIYAAAERRPDICAKDPASANAINVDALAVLAQAAKQIGAWLLYFSTDYVFDGTQPPYQPNNDTNPLNEYALGKLKGEQALWNITDNACVLRLPILYGNTEDLNESAVTVLANALLSNETRILMDDWAIRYPTHTADIAIVCRQMIQHKIPNKDFNGTFHWSGNEAFTKYQMALVMAKILGVNKDIIPNSTNPSEVARPHNCHLDTSDLQALGIGANRQFKAGISPILSKYKIS